MESHKHILNFSTRGKGKLGEWGSNNSSIYCHDSTITVLWGGGIPPPGRGIVGKNRSTQSKKKITSRIQAAYSNLAVEFTRSINDL